MRLPLIVLAVAVSLTSSAALAQAQPAASKPSADECAVWDREASFAQSVEQHDAKAFAEHLHADASFINGRGAVARGRHAVVADWTPLVEGKGVRLHWYPDAVTVGGRSGVAVSRGPYWIENPAQDAKTRFIAGRFISTWVRDGKGIWHVLYDGGGGNMAQPATAAEIAALIAARTACPR